MRTDDGFGELETLVAERGRALMATATLLAGGRSGGEDLLLAALARLPPRQRAVLVLRYWEQLSEAETAARLGCSLGTVKSSASRGLARLREITEVRTENGVLS